MGVHLSYYWSFLDSDKVQTHR